ncbi:MAG: exodeoxyribonuclease V subunit beta, partial [Methylococcaceae bacterium]|nr:exodeoxyribonuclease V subunit beta [Methylococcaceae bacterium]
SFDDYFAQREPGLELPEKLLKLTRQELEKGTAKNQSTPEHPFFDACPALIDAATELAEQFRLKLVDLQIRLIEHCNDELPRRKTRLGLLSYNDLLNRLHQALQDKSGGHLAGTLCERYPAALIDGFQDTDPVQYAIFQAIYGSGAQPVFFVGDPKQAIYGFRGADVFSYLQARDQAQAHYTLAVNQRSAPELITAVNALFLRSPNPFLFDDIGYPPVKAADKSRPKLEIEGDMRAPFRFVLAPGGDKPLNKEDANRLSAQSTATEIVRLLNLAAKGKARLVEPASPKDLSRPLGGGDIAVLVPTHRQGELVQVALTARGVPAVRQGQDTVYACDEAGELERILLAIAEPQREALIKSALATTLTGMDAAAIFALQNDESAWESILAGLARYREIWLGRGFMPMFCRWLEESGVTERLLAYRDGERRLTNLLHLAELLQVASRDKAGPDELLGWLSRHRGKPEGDEETLLRLESDAERVKIVTIHTSKGLEYPIVFCPFLWDGNLWRKDETAATFHDPDHGNHTVLDLAGVHDETHRSLASQEKLAEKLRLLYVALTRAKHRCYAVWGHFKEMETSALTWLLHGSAEPIEDPLPFLADAVKELNHATIEQTLLDFAKQAPEAVAVESLRIDETRYVPPPSPKQNLQTLAFHRPYLRPSWRMTSFSALSQGRHNEGPDYDSILGESEEMAPERSIFAFPRGAGAGRCLHAIFEEWDFASSDSAALERLVRRKLKAHAIDQDWAPIVAAMVQAVLNADLDSSGLKLVNIESGDRLAEMEFTYPLGELESGGLKQGLMDPDLGLPVEFAQAAAGLNFETVKGYMKGFIDLVFEASGRFYLLDYKSNWLGAEPRHYAHPSLLKAMAREHYYLQYLIYCLALHRYLGLRLPDYDYEAHFGGVFYLFLRGIGHPGAPDCGLFRDRPGQKLIEALDALLS